MNRFKSSAELKAGARERLLGHYGTVIGAELITLVLSGTASFAVSILVDITTVIGSIIYYAILFFISILMGLFTSGTCYLYLKLICGRPVSVNDLFYGFGLPGQSYHRAGMVYVAHLCLQSAAVHPDLQDLHGGHQCG